MLFQPSRKPPRPSIYDGSRSRLSPYHGVLMPDLTRLQKLWDAYLITRFYEKPFYNIHRTARFFRETHDIPVDTFHQLQRTPLVVSPNSTFFVNNKDVYSFVAQNLPDLYKVIEPRDVTDLFEILTWLKHQNITSQPQKGVSSDDRKIIVNGVRQARVNMYIGRLENATFGKGAIAHQAFFKPSK